MSAAKKDKDDNSKIKLGDRVIVKGQHTGVVKFVGPLDDSREKAPTYIGVQLYDNVGSLHNGMFRGKRYFHCPPGHGAMVKAKQVVKVSSGTDKKQTSKGNMFPSYQEIKTNRRERSAKDPEFDFGPPYGSSRPTSSTVNIGDKNDMAVKDAQKQEELQKKKYEKASSKQEDSAEEGSSERNIQQWKKKFGNDERADKMAQTLQKLQIAYEKGLEYRREEEEEAAAAALAEQAPETESETWSERGDWG